MTSIKTPPLKHQRVSKRKTAIPASSISQNSILDSDHTPVGESEIQCSRPPTTGSRSGADGLQPSGVLNHEALKGRFSLRHILGSGENERSERYEDESDTLSEDPVRLGLINISIAQCLFDQSV